METIARIRREHFVKGKTIKEIARDLGVSRNTIRKVLRSGETSFEYQRRVQPRPKLGRWTAELDTILTGNAAKPAREQLTLIRIYEELHDRGYPRETQEMVFDAHDRAFAFFKGTCRRGIYDNMKTAVETIFVGIASTIVVSCRCAAIT